MVKNETTKRGRTWFRFGNDTIHFRISETELEIVNDVGEMLGHAEQSKTLRFMVRFLGWELGIPDERKSGPRNPMKPIDEIQWVLGFENTSEVVRFAIHFAAFRMKTDPETLETNPSVR